MPALDDQHVVAEIGEEVAVLVVHGRGERQMHLHRLMGRVGETEDVHVGHAPRHGVAPVGRVGYASRAVMDQNDPCCSARDGPGRCRSREMIRERR
jgi:hypothetical protein